MGKRKNRVAKRENGESISSEEGGEVGELENLEPEEYVEMDKEPGWRPVNVKGAVVDFEGLLGFDEMDGDDYETNTLQDLEAQDAAEAKAKKQKKKKKKQPKESQEGQSNPNVEIEEPSVSPVESEEGQKKKKKKKKNKNKNEQQGELEENGELVEEVTDTVTASEIKQPSKKQGKEAKQKGNQPNQNQNQKQNQKQSSKQDKQQLSKQDKQQSSKQENKKQSNKGKEEETVEPKKPKKVNLSHWAEFDLHPEVLKGLGGLGFHTPTAIQRQCMRPIITQWKDVVGVAQTGSGKTLAFGIPILHRYLTSTNRESGALFALILTPTRELALQVSAHIAKLAGTNMRVVAIVGGIAEVKQQRQLRARPPTVVATPGRLWELMQQGEPHVSDLSHLGFLVFDEADRMVQSGHFPELNKIIDLLEKQTRQQTSDLPPALVGVEVDEQPDQGEKAEEEEEGEEQPNQSTGKPKKGKANALQTHRKRVKHGEDGDDEGDDEGDEGDEGDDVEAESVRLEKGEKVLVADKEDDDWLEEEEEELKNTPGKKLTKKEKKRLIQLRRKRKMIEMRKQRAGGLSKKEQAALDAKKKRQENLKIKRQTLLFSATLSLGAQGREGFTKKFKQSQLTMIDQLKGRMTFCRGDPVLVDLSTKHMVATLVEEGKVDCLNEDKDMYLYYILHSWKSRGRVLVFVNSIATLRRTVALFLILGFPVLGLHAHMQQRQRLKNLDRFKESKDGVIICSDVAARGLDIPLVPLVVHYQLPRAAEVYIHRTGRTARAGAPGTSVAFVSEQDQANYKRLCTVLDRPQGIPDFQVEPLVMDAIRERVTLGRKLDLENHAVKKQHDNKEWFLRQADLMDMALDDELVGEYFGGKPIKGKKKKHDEDEENEQARTSGKVAALRAQLNLLIAQPLVKRGVARGFFTLNNLSDLGDTSKPIDVEKVARS